MFAPNGYELYSMATGVDAFRFWSQETGMRMDGIECGSTMLLCFSVSPNCGRIAAVGVDGGLRIWSREVNGWELMLQSMVGTTRVISWRQSLDCMYLSTAYEGSLRIWKLWKSEDRYSLQLLWGEGSQEISFMDAKMDDIDSLSPVNRQFMMQRVVPFADDDEDEVEEEGWVMDEEYH